jgi:hypothetical protein
MDIPPHNTHPFTAPKEAKKKLTKPLLSDADGKLPCVFRVSPTLHTNHGKNRENYYFYRIFFGVGGNTGRLWGYPAIVSKVELLHPKVAVTW